MCDITDVTQMDTERRKECLQLILRSSLCSRYLSFLFYTFQTHLFCFQMPFRTQWRDVKCLHGDGIPIDTSRDETAKLFDATLTQYTGW